MDGTDVRALRKHLGVTQEEFAHQVGVTFATVNRWENGRSKPSRLALRILLVLTQKAEASARKPAPGKKGRPKRR